MEIASRHSPKSIERFAQVMGVLNTSWPQPILVNPAPLSVETFRSRFRDAVFAIVNLDQCPHLLPVCETWAADFRIEEKGGKLIIGPKTVLLSQAQSAQPVGQVLDGVVSLAAGAELAITPSSKIIDACVVLIEAGFLSSVTLNLVSEAFVRQHLPTDSLIELMEKDGKIVLF